MEVEKCLDTIKNEYQNILGKNLIGIYLHGSYALGGFQETSDLDFIVVCKMIPSLKEKSKLIQVLLELNDEAPAKGFEMSLVLKRYTKSFIYPTPYELHYSQMHMNAYHANLEQTAAQMHGSDYDLAAHFAVLLKKGLVLYGDEISRVFCHECEKFYLNSIHRDMINARQMIEKEPVYTVLNLCRTACYLKEDVICSKLDGAQWALKKLPKNYHSVIHKAMISYQNGLPCKITAKQANDFIKFMIERKVIE